MQIVIEIDDELYEEILSRKYSKTKLEKAVADGTPLPKGHGRLIDANALYNDLEFPTKQFAEAFKEILNDAPIVIGVDVPGTDVGKKGGMTNTELKQILQEIKDDCLEHKICQGCKFCLYEGCALTHIPDEWNLDKIGLEESEEV